MAIIKVASQTQLDSAVKNVKSGDTILLASGAKFTQLLFDSKVMASTVTIKSESATNPATIGYVRAINSNNVVFQDIKVGRAMTPGIDQNWTNMALVQTSKNVTFDNVKFFATGADSSLLGRGLFVRSSDTVTVKNSDFSHTAIGMTTMETSAINLQSNKFHDLRIDGAQFTAITGGTINGNDFRDFRSSAVDHPDAIQVWTAGTLKGSTDLVITNNVIMPGTGNGGQGIFIQDEAGTAPHERITIKNNLLLDAGNFYNGITVRGGKSVVIDGNTSVSPTGDNKNFWIRLDSVSGATVTNNLADQFIQSKNTGVSVSGNVFLNEQKAFASKISGLNLFSSATVDSLVVAGVGYQLPAGSMSAVTPVTSPTGAFKSTDVVTTTDPILTPPSASSTLVSATVAAAATTSPTATSTTSSTSPYVMPTTFSFSSLSDLLTPIAKTPVTKAVAPIISVANVAVSEVNTTSAAGLVAPGAVSTSQSASATSVTKVPAAAAISPMVVSSLFTSNSLSGMFSRKLDGRASSLN